MGVRSTRISPLDYYAITLFITVNIRKTFIYFLSNALFTLNTLFTQVCSFSRADWWIFCVNNNHILYILFEFNIAISHSE